MHSTNCIILKRYCKTVDSYIIKSKPKLPAKLLGTVLCSFVFRIKKKKKHASIYITTSTQYRINFM